MPSPRSCAARGLSKASLPVADDDLALVGPVIAHDALDQRALAGAVLAEQRVQAAGPDPHRDLVERDEVAETLGHADGLDAESAGGGHQPSASRNAFASETAPNTPPCILIILMAWS